MDYETAQRRSRVEAGCRAHGIKPGTLAVRVGTSRQYFYGVLSGKRPGTGLWEKIAAYFKCDVAWLTLGVGPAPAWASTGPVIVHGVGRGTPEADIRSATYLSGEPAPLPAPPAPATSDDIKALLSTLRSQMEENAKEHREIRATLARLENGFPAHCGKPANRRKDTA
jgi:hypothetical protein